jgi:hypothetical protein
MTGDDLVDASMLSCCNRPYGSHQNLQQKTRKQTKSTTDGCFSAAQLPQPAVRQPLTSLDQHLQHVQQFVQCWCWQSCNTARRTCYNARTMWHVAELQCCCFCDRYACYSSFLLQLDTPLESSLFLT